VKDNQTANELESKVLSWQVNDRLLNKLRKNPKFSADDIQALINELTLRRIEATELQEVRAELQDSINQYQEFYNLFSAGYLVISDNNIIKEANRVIAKDFNEKIEDLIGVDFFRFVTPDSQDTFQQYISNLLRTRSRNVCGLFLKKKNGQTFAVKVTGYARKDFKGKFDLRLIISTPQDLSKEGENPIVLLDIEGNILFMNKAMCKVTGYSNHELLGESIADFLVEEDQSKVMKRLIKARVGVLMGSNMEFGVKCKNQQYAYFKTVPRPLKIQGQIQGFMVVLHKSVKHLQAKK
jgi:PAS domain S-box-containing protein